MSSDTATQRASELDSAFIELAIEMAALDCRKSEHYEAGIRAASTVLEEAAEIHRSIEE